LTTNKIHDKPQKPTIMLTNKVIHQLTNFKQTNDQGTVRIREKKIDKLISCNSI